MTINSTAVSILDCASARIGRPASTGADFYDAGLPMFGGCEGCGASIAAYNAFPSRSGFIRCRGCVAGVGFATVADFEAFAADEERET